jgi:hypothetical protein
MSTEPIDVDIKPDSFSVSIDTEEGTIGLVRFKGKDQPQTLAQALVRIKRIIRAAKRVTGKERASMGVLRNALKGVEILDPKIKTMMCGCCSNGCVCWMHRDVARGLPERKCDYHAGGDNA